MPKLSEVTAAPRKLKLSEVRASAPSGQIEAGNIDLNNRPRVRNPDGSISTVRSISANFDGREVLIPTVSDDGRIMSDEDAIKEYQRTGRNLGSFDTPENATAYAEQLHKDQERIYATPTGGRFGGVSPGFDVSATVDTTAEIPRQRTAAEELGRSFGLGTRAAIGGLADIVGIVSNPFIEAVNLFGEKGPTTSSLVTGQPERRFPRQATQREGAEALSDYLGLPKPETATERVAGGITSAVTGGGGLIGLGRGLVAQAPIVGAALASQPGAQIAGAALGSGASGVTREAGGGPTAQLAAGLAGGLAPSVPRAAADVASGLLSGQVPEIRKEIARSAQDMGIKLTPGQLSDSRFLKWAQSMLRSVPFTGAQGRYQGQVAQFNRQLAREIGENAEGLKPEVMSAAKARQSQQFDDLTSRNALRVDDTLVKSLSNIAEGSKVGGETIQNQVESAIDALYSQATTSKGGVVIPGAAYQAFDAQMNNLIKSGGPQAHFLGSVQSAVRRAMDNSISPKDAAAWRQLRREYGSRKTLAPLAARSAEGEVKPAQVLGAVTATRTGKEAQAAGQRGNLGQLARVGQLLKEPPTSGTAERGVVSGLLGGASIVDPVTGGLTAVGLNLLSRGIDSNGLAQLMIRENPGLTLETAQAIIQRSAAPAAIISQQERR